MESPHVSIIVPSYNVEKFLDRFFESILNQTCKNFELIFVDDASPDQTGKMCEEYAARHDFVKVYHNERNGGLSVARNVGLEYATGRYISFVDPDDTVDATFIEKMYTFANQNNCDIVVCGRYEIYPKKPTDTFVYHFETAVPEKKMIMQQLFDDNIGSHSCDKIFKRELWSTKHFTPGRVYGEDITVMHEIFDSANRIGFISEPLYHYYINEASLTSSYRPFKWMSLYLAFKERLEFAEQKYPHAMLGKLTCYTVNYARLTLDNYLLRRESCDEPYMTEVIGRIKKQKRKTGQLSHMKWHNRLMIRYYNFSPFLYARSIKLIHKIFYTLKSSEFS